MMTVHNKLAQIPIPLLDWYHAHARVLPWRDPIVPYHSWISEIMLQQTRVEAVTAYYNRFLTALPTIEALAEVPEQELMKLWEGLGYYNRARNLQKAAKLVMSEFAGQLPADYEALQTLPGIGRYTAGAIASIVFSIPVPAVDGNVLRVLVRVLASDRNISRPQTKAFFEQVLLKLLQTEPARSLVSDFNQSLMELGALVCVPNGAPKCLLCPLREICLGYVQNIAETLPIKDEKKARTIQEKTMLLLHCRGLYALCKRPDTGLLAVMWELPNTDRHLAKAEVPETLALWGLQTKSVHSLGKCKHIFTHIEWRMIGFLVEVEKIPENSVFTWVSAAEAEACYPLPSAFDHYRKAMK